MAFSLIVPVVGSIALSGVRSVPWSSSVLPSGAKAVTGSFPAAIARLMRGNVSCGRVKSTEIGWIWVTVTIPVGSEACTMLPGST